MHFKLLLLVAAVASITAGLPVERRDREGRTLGLMQWGLQTAGAGLGAVGSAASTALGVAAAAKPLIFLGLGKYALWNYLNRPGNQVGFTVGYTAPDFAAPAQTYYAQNEQPFQIYEPAQFNNQPTNNYNW